VQATSFRSIFVGILVDKTIRFTLLGNEHSSI
jgi:hypothetical protein